MIKRNLDGIFYRVKRDGKYEDVCFSDMTLDEIDEVIGERPATYWKKVALHLKDRLNLIGETFEFVVNDDV